MSYLKIKELEEGDTFTHEGEEWKKYSNHKSSLYGAGIIAVKKENGKRYHRFISDEEEVFQ